MSKEAAAGAWRRLARYRPELVHGTRMTVAGLAAYLLVHLLGLSEGLWAAITAIIVTQSSIGGSLKVAFEQLAGSLSGAVYATLIVLAIRPDDQLSSVLALVAALAPLSMLAAGSPGFRVAPITGAIILLGGAGPGVGPVGFAAHRVLEVSLGSGVGVTVSLLVAPAQASRAVLEAATRLAGLLADQLESLAVGRRSARTDLVAPAGRIRNDLIRLEMLVEDAAHERRSLLSGLPDLMPLLRTMRRLRQDVSILRRAAQATGDDRIDRQLAGAWSGAIKAGAAALRRTGRLLRQRDAATDTNELAQAVRAYRAALEEMRRAGETESLSTAALERLFWVGFALDLFRRDMDELAQRAQEIAAARRPRDGNPFAGPRSDS